MGGLQAVGNLEIYDRKNGLELFDIGALKYLVNVVKKFTVYSVFISLFHMFLAMTSTNFDQLVSYLNNGFIHFRKNF